MANPLDAAFGDGSIGRQLLMWQVLGQVVGSVMQPAVLQIMDEVWPRLTSVRLSPAQAADLVLKGWWDQQRGRDEASATGVDADRFDKLVQSAGEPISPMDALTAFRRGIIPEDAGPGGAVSFMQSVRESRLRPEWGPVLAAMQWQPLPVADAVDAVVENQITPEQGAKYAREGGIAQTEFDTLVHTRGNPPSPTQLLELYRRGYIELEGTGPDRVTFQQGIFEGATKDKWWTYFAKLQQYVPPPRTVTALEREGAITQQEAQALYAANGLDAQLAAVYSNAASSQKLAKHKDLAEATVLQMYEDQIISKQEASDALAALGYSAQESAWLMQLHDMQRALSALNSAVSKIGNLYIARKLTQNDAATALAALGLPADQVTSLMTVWGLEQAATVKVLTQAEITSAYFYKVIDIDTAIAYLVQLGYSQYDAWVLLSARNHAPIGTPPAEGQNVTGRAQ